MLNVVDRLKTVPQLCYVQLRMNLCFRASRGQQEVCIAVFAGQSGSQRSLSLALR